MSSKPPARDRVRRSRATAAAGAIGAGVAAGLGEEATSNPLGFDSPFDDLIGQFFGGRDPFSVLGAERPRRRCNESICPGR